jgi:hypothetical protein
MTMIEVEPQPRIDTLVRLAAGGEARGTEYVGTVWFDGKPIVAGLTLQRGLAGVRRKGCDRLRRGDVHRRGSVRHEPPRRLVDRTLQR